MIILIGFVISPYMFDLIDYTILLSLFQVISEKTKSDHAPTRFVICLIFIYMSQRRICLLEMLNNTHSSQEYLTFLISCAMIYKTAFYENDNMINRTD